MRYSLLIAGLILGPASIVSAADYTLKASPSTVVWGYYSGAEKPALTVHSGDTVRMQGLASCGSTEALVHEGIKASDVPAYNQEIYDQVKDKGPGGHILTGPIYVDEAEPGDVLEVQILKVDLDVDFACNHFRPGSGFLPNEFPYNRSKIIPLDRARMVANFGPGITIPLRPFFGSMGIAPGSATRLNSAPPWMHGGNMDNKELVAGTSVFYPVQSKGALFQVGDGHAGQGNGEVDITAMETFLSGTFKFIVHKHETILWPRAETPTYYISMGFSPDLKTAAELSLRDMIAFLVEKKHMTRDDAYMLTSVACDMDVTQVVDGNDGVHVMCPKNIFSAPNNKE